ncbi:MAG: hypothetical protein FD152_1297 [Xanthobacteraceae bacterium]|nr:MAG: hypothetical protein FD152_1297 [Xanthobacteraceae bacterium]
MSPGRSDPPTMRLKASSLPRRWTDAHPRTWRRLLPFVLVLLALAAALPPVRHGHDPLRQAGWERLDGELAVLREPETIRILRREAPDSRDRTGPAGDDTAVWPVVLRLATVLAPVGSPPASIVPRASRSRLERPQPRAPPALSAA